MVLRREDIGGLAIFAQLDRHKVGVVEFTGLVSKVKEETTRAAVEPDAARLRAGGTGVVDYKAPTASNLSAKEQRATSLARFRDVEERLELLKGRDYLPAVVIGSHWETYKGYMDGEDPSWSGEIDERKAKDLGLYGDKKVIRVYEDMFVMPR